MGGPADASVETLLLRVLIQVIIIIAAARIFGGLFRRLGQPQVCGEVAAGLILGPSMLGKLAPNLFAAVFTTSVGPIFNVMSQLGLILLMFLVGLEFDFAHLKTHGRTAFSTSIVGIILPFGLGFFLAQAIYPWVGGGINKLGFSLMLATALSITAIPVLSRIMMDLNITRSAIGTITITAAAIDDVSGWIILAVVAAVVRSQFSGFHSVMMLLETLAFGAAVFFVLRPLMKRWIRSTVEREGSDLSLGTLTMLMVFVFSCAVVTNLIGIFSIFGAFLAGAAIHDEEKFRHAVSIRLRDFTTAFFLPIFFTYTGLRTDIGTMTGATLWLICGLVIAASVVGKLGGCMLSARFFGGLSWRDSATIGILMNTRGLMELIVINLGYELGVIPRNVFFMLVLMAVVTTYMTTPLVRRAIRNTELESLVEASPFVLGHRKTIHSEP
jgi:Kef-type K+ transport system membrane component KefB